MSFTSSSSKVTANNVERRLYNIGGDMALFFRLPLRQRELQFGPNFTYIFTDYGELNDPLFDILPDRKSFNLGIAVRIAL